MDMLTFLPCITLGLLGAEGIGKTKAGSLPGTMVSPLLYQLMTAGTPQPSACSRGSETSCLPSQTEANQLSAAEINLVLGSKMVFVLPQLSPGLSQVLCASV